LGRRRCRGLDALRPGGGGREAMSWRSSNIGVDGAPGAARPEPGIWRPIASPRRQAKTEPASDRRTIEVGAGCSSRGRDSLVPFAAGRGPSEAAGAAWFRRRPTRARDVVAEHGWAISPRDRRGRRSRANNPPPHHLVTRNRRGAGIAAPPSRVLTYSQAKPAGAVVRGGAGSPASIMPRRLLVRRRAEQQVPGAR